MTGSAEYFRIAAMQEYEMRSELDRWCTHTHLTHIPLEMRGIVGLDSMVSRRFFKTARVVVAGGSVRRRAEVANKTHSWFIFLSFAGKIKSAEFHTL